MGVKLSAAASDAAFDDNPSPEICMQTKEKRASRFACRRTATFF